MGHTRPHFLVAAQSKRATQLMPYGEAGLNDPLTTALEILLDHSPITGARVLLFNFLSRRERRDIQWLQEHDRLITLADFVNTGREQVRLSRSSATLPDSVACKISPAPNLIESEQKLELGSMVALNYPNIHVPPCICAPIPRFPGEYYNHCDSPLL